MASRRRTPHVLSFHERLLEEAARLRREADHASSAAERERLLRKAQSLGTVSDIERWITSPGLQPPT